MHPRGLKRLFDEFGHRMLDQAWRGDLLMQRGCLDVEDLRDAVHEGYFTVHEETGAPIRLSDYFTPHLATAHFAIGCYYRLTAKGWWTGVAIGANFESPAEQRIAAVWGDDCLGYD